jgi:hypothetical protein
MCHHPFCVNFLVGLVIVAMGSAPASANEAEATGIFKCMLSAFSTDKNPDGLNVRAGPGVEAPVIARLPPPYKVGSETFATEVSITGSKDGWFRIDRADADAYIVESGPKLVFEGEGWVSGRYLGLWVEGQYLYRGPSPDTPVAFDFTDEQPSGQGPDFFALDRLRACQGYWVEVEGNYFGQNLRGWTDDTCSSQVTTCP